MVAAKIDRIGDNTAELQAAGMVKSIYRLTIDIDASAHKVGDYLTIADKSADHQIRMPLLRLSDSNVLAPAALRLSPRNARSQTLPFRLRNGKTARITRVDVPSGVSADVDMKRRAAEHLIRISASMNVKKSFSGRISVYTDDIFEEPYNVELVVE